MIACQIKTALKMFTSAIKTPKLSHVDNIWQKSSTYGKKQHVIIEPSPFHT